MQTRRLVALTSLLTVAALADTLQLRDGSTVTGTFVGGDSRQLRMLINGDVQRFLISDTVNLRFGDSDSSTLPNTPPPPPRQQSQAANDPVNQPAYLEPRRDDQQQQQLQDRGQQDRGQDVLGQDSQYYGMVIPAGTRISVRLIDDVDSRRDQVGQNYRATLDNDIVVDGQTVVRRGADVIAKLVNAQESGKMGGRTEMTLDLSKMRIDNRMVDLNTSVITHASSSRGKKAAATVGGVAALGAILGAIAGGGGGAAIGAASGAAVGAGATILTKGERVVIPSETRLTFSLQQDIPL